MSFSPPRIPFQFRPQSPLPYGPAGWVCVAGRTIVAASVATSSFGPPAGTFGFLGYYLDANNTPPGAGQVQIATPPFTLESGNTYDVRMQMQDSAGVVLSDIRWSNTVYTGMTVLPRILAFSIIGEGISAPLEILSRGVTPTRPWLGDITVTRTSV